MRSRLDDADGTMGLRAALLKRKATEWLIEHVTIKDEDGVVLDRTLFRAVPEEDVPGLHDHDHDHDDDDAGGDHTGHDRGGDAAAEPQPETADEEDDE